jgi:hypothetical protein
MRIDDIQHVGAVAKLPCSAVMPVQKTILDGDNLFLSNNRHYIFLFVGHLQI